MRCLETLWGAWVSLLEKIKIFASYHSTQSPWPEMYPSTFLELHMHGFYTSTEIPVRFSQHWEVESVADMSL